MIMVTASKDNEKFGLELRNYTVTNILNVAKTEGRFIDDRDNTPTIVKRLLVLETNKKTFICPVPKGTAKKVCLRPLYVCNEDKRLHQFDEKLGSTECYLDLREFVGKFNDSNFGKRIVAIVDL